MANITHTEDHIVSEGQYLEDVVGVVSINDLFNNNAKQLRVKRDTRTFIHNKTDDFICLDKGTWVSIYNYKIEANVVFPKAVLVITNTGDTFDVNMNTLVNCFDCIGYVDGQL